MAQPTVQMVLSLELEGKAHQIDIFNLRSRERMALERHADMPAAEILSSKWLQSELVLSFAAYLAVARERPNLSYEAFLDLYDEDRVSNVKLRTDVANRDYSTMTVPELKKLVDERELKHPNGRVKKADLVALLEGSDAGRPTKSQPTSGSPS